LGLPDVAPRPPLFHYANAGHGALREQEEKVMRISALSLRRILVLITGSMSACIAVAATSTTSTPAAAPDELDEVLVSGTRLWQLRAAVIKAEDRLLARYNELNPEQDFDIECVNRTPTGTHISHRYCFTGLQKRIEQKDAWMMMTALVNQDVPGTTQSVSEMSVQLLERAADYRQNLTTLLQDHPELRALARQHGEVRRRYEAALQDRREARQRR
jgi:hypothetical protein